MPADISFLSQTKLHTEEPKRLSSAHLIKCLYQCSSLKDLRQLAKVNKNRLNAIHYNSICSACGRLGTENDGNDKENMRNEAIVIYSIAVRNWINLPFDSKGRNARSCSNIMHIGAKLHIDVNTTLYRDLCEVAALLGTDFDVQGVSNCLWAVATLGATSSNEVLLPVLISKCFEKARYFDAHSISNCLWAAATLEITNWDLIRRLYDVCIRRIKDLTHQGLCNCFWAVAILGETCKNDDVVSPLLKACLEQLRYFKAVDLSFFFKSVALLGITDQEVIQDISQICISRVNEFSAQNAVTCLWAIANLGEEITGSSFTSIIADLCLQQYKELKDRDVVVCLWSLAVLDNHRFSKLSSILRLVILSRYKFITSHGEAFQCLQAHYSGIILSEDVLVHFHAIAREKKLSLSTTGSQDAVAEALRLVGYSPRLEVPLFDGLVTVDIVIDLCNVQTEKKDKHKFGRKREIAIEFDGPWHFMRKTRGSTDKVGPMDARTRLRNSLIEKSGLFEALIIIPFYEWDEARRYQGKYKREGKSCDEPYDSAIDYLKEKIAFITS
jgi:hypothetical protein